MAKKVAIYPNSSDLNSGGGLFYVLCFAKTFQDIGYSVDIIFKENIDSKKIKINYNLYGFNILIEKKYLFLNQITTALFEFFNYDIVILHSNYIPRLTFVKKAYILCDFPFSKKIKLKEKFRLLFWKNCITNSEFTKYWIGQFWSKKAIVINPPLLDSSEFSTKEDVFISIGRFNSGLRSKNQHLILKAFIKTFEKNQHNYKLIFLGFVQDKKYLDELIKTADGYPVEFYTNISHNEKKHLLSSSKFYIHACGYNVNVNTNPEHVEHFGISIIESLSAGTIPLVLPIGGPKEIIENDFNGLYWNTTDDLVKLMTNIFNNKIDENRLRNNAIQSSESYFYETFKKKVSNLII